MTIFASRSNDTQSRMCEVATCQAEIPPLSFNCPECGNLTLKETRLWMTRSLYLAPALILLAIGLMHDSWPLYASLSLGLTTFLFFWFRHVPAAQLTSVLWLVPAFSVGIAYSRLPDSSNIVVNAAAFGYLAIVILYFVPQHLLFWSRHDASGKLMLTGAAVMTFAFYILIFDIVDAIVAQGAVDAILPLHWYRVVRDTYVDIRYLLLFIFVFLAVTAAVYNVTRFSFPKPIGGMVTRVVSQLARFVRGVLDEALRLTIELVQLFWKFQLGFVVDVILPFVTSIALAAVTLRLSVTISRYVVSEDVSALMVVMIAALTAALLFTFAYVVLAAQAFDPERIIESVAGEIVTVWNAAIADSIYLIHLVFVVPLTTFLFWFLRSRLDLPVVSPGFGAFSIVSVVLIVALVVHDERSKRARQK